MPMISIKTELFSMFISMNKLIVSFEKNNNLFAVFEIIVSEE
jgi:hypothetical protein